MIHFLNTCSHVCVVESETKQSTFRVDGDCAFNNYIMHITKILNIMLLIICILFLHNNKSHPKRDLEPEIWPDIVPISEMMYASNKYKQSFLKHHQGHCFETSHTHTRVILYTHSKGPPQECH